MVPTKVRGCRAREAHGDDLLNDEDGGGVPKAPTSMLRSDPICVSAYVFAFVHTHFCNNCRQHYKKTRQHKCTETVPPHFFGSLR